MAFLTDLWLPILLSSVFVFVASSVIHMVLSLHKSDYKLLADEETLLGAMRGTPPAPGLYMIPGCESMNDLAKPEMVEKFRRGPVGFLIVRPSGVPSLGKSLLQWFLFTIFVGIVTAYVTSLGLPKGASYVKVFQLSGTVALMAHAFSSVHESIWKGLSWNITAKFFFDGVVYALVTAGTFGWLWPKAI